MSKLDDDRTQTDKPTKTDLNHEIAELRKDNEALMGAVAQMAKTLGDVQQTITKQYADFVKYAKAGKF